MFSFLAYSIPLLRLECFCYLLFFCEGVMKHLPSFPLLLLPLSPPPPPPRSVPQKVSLWAAAAETKLSKRRFHYPTTVAGGGLFFPPPLLSLFRDIVSSTRGVGGRRGGRGLALRIQSGAVRRNLRMHNLAAQQRTQRLRCRRETVPPRSVASASPACIYG